MSSVLRILALVTCVVVVMPPQWCRALPGSPFACCDACAEELDDQCLSEEGEETPEPTEQASCQCGKIAFKQPDEVVAAVFVVPQIAYVSEDTGSVPVVHSCDVPPPRNLQRLLCCWRK